MLQQIVIKKETYNQRGITSIKVIFSSDNANQARRVLRHLRRRRQPWQVFVMQPQYIFCTCRQPLGSNPQCVHCKNHAFLRKYNLI